MHTLIHTHSLSLSTDRAIATTAVVRWRRWFTTTTTINAHTRVVRAAVAVIHARVVTLALQCAVVVAPADQAVVLHCRERGRPQVVAGE